MTSCKSDSYWNGSALGCGADLYPWLNDHGSLTARIQQRCAQFAVRPVRSGLARIAYDEAAVLGIAPHRLAYSREVFLHADGRPVVFAHSACRARDLLDRLVAWHHFLRALRKPTPLCRTGRSKPTRW